MVEKRVIIAKQNNDKDKKTYTKGRTCLNCGINIDHRSPKVNFCCPACKAIYNERQELMANEKPVLKPPHIFDPKDAASVYFPIETAKSRLKIEPKRTIVTSTPHMTSDMTQMQKFYERYGK